MSGMPEILIGLSPVVFAAALSLFYARDRAVRVGGFFLGVFALFLATYFFLAVTMGVVGVVVFIVRPPAWWFREEPDHPT